MENLARKGGPGYIRRPGKMIGSGLAQPQRQQPPHLDQGCRYIACGGWPADLVRDNRQRVARFAQPQHGLHKVAAMRGKDPGRAQNGKAAPCGMDAMFPGKLGPAIAAQRPGGVIRLPGAGAAAVENIVCRYVQKRKAARCCRLRHPCRGRGVDPHRHVFIGLGLIHCRIGGGIDHNLGVAGGNRIGASVWLAQIGVAARQEDGPWQLHPQLLRNLTGRSEDKRLHALTPRRVPTPWRSCKGRHQASLSRYHCTVRARPSSTVTEGRQPSSVRIRVGSMA